MITLKSFGKKYGPEPECAVVLDCSTMPNPWYDRRLRKLDGRHPEVQKVVFSRPGAAKLIAGMGGRVLELQDGATVGFMCHGGKHRSVAVAEMVARYVGPYRKVHLVHRDLKK